MMVMVMVMVMVVLMMMMMMMMIKNEEEQAETTEDKHKYILRNTHHDDDGCFMVFLTDHFFSLRVSLRRQGSTPIGPIGKVLT